MGVPSISGMPIGQGKSIYTVSFEGKERTPRITKIDIAVMPFAPLMFYQLVLVIEKEGKFLARVSGEMEKQLKQVGTPLVFEGEEVDFDLMDEDEANELQKIFNVANAAIGINKTDTKARKTTSTSLSAPQAAASSAPDVDKMDAGFIRMSFNQLLKHGRNFIEEIKRQVLDRWHENVQKEKEAFTKSSKEIREKKDVKTHELGAERVKKEAVAAEQAKKVTTKVEAKDE